MSAPAAVWLERLTDLPPLSSTTDCADPAAATATLVQGWGGPVVPVLLEPGVPAWLVTTAELITRMAQDEHTFSRDSNHWRLLTEGRVAADSGLAPMMFPRRNAYFADGAEHARLRRVIVAALAQVNEHQQVRLVRDTCDALIRRFARRGSADLVAEYAAQVPMLAVARMLGLSPALSQELQRCLIALFGSGEDAQRGNLDLENLLDEVIRARRAAPADDMTSAFLAHPNLRSDEEVRQTMVLVVSAGWETTRIWITRALVQVLTDDRFAADLRRGRLSTQYALGEVLWRDPPMTNMPGRYALADTVLGTQRIRRGDALILGLAAANADPAVRTGNPWLDEGNEGHLAFSTGPHACPAQRTARLIARTAVDALLHHLHHLQLSVPAEELPLQPSPWTRGYATLPVTFTPDQRILTQLAESAEGGHRHTTPAPARHTGPRSAPGSGDSRRDTARLRAGQWARALLPAPVTAWAPTRRTDLTAVARRVVGAVHRRFHPTPQEDTRDASPELTHTRSQCPVHHP